MTPIRSILVATDLSLDASNAVRRASLLAQQFDAHLTLLHVVNPVAFKPLRHRSAHSIDLETHQARAALRKVAAEIASQHDVSTNVEVRVGDVHEELLSASQHVDLMVLGRSQKRSIKDLLMGSKAERLLSKCVTPVLVVKRTAERLYRQVLVPVDLGPTSETTVHLAARLAPDVGIEVFHALDSPREAVLREASVAPAVLSELRTREEARVNARMRGGVARAGLDGRRVRFSLAYGRTVHSTLRKLHALEADLLVVGKQKRSPIGALLVGSISRRLLTRAACDVVIVPRVPPRTAVSARSPFVRRDVPTVQHNGRLA